MDDMWFDLPPVDEIGLSGHERPPLSGTYTGRRGSDRLRLRVDLKEPGSGGLYGSLNLVSGDFFRYVGGGEWDYRYSFIVEHPYVHWGTDELTVVGTMVRYGNSDLVPQQEDMLARHTLRAVIPLSGSHESPKPATVEVIRWGLYKASYLCDKVSAFQRTIDLEIDRISGTELPRLFSVDSVTEHPPDLPSLELDIPRAYQRAGIDMRIVADSEVFSPAEAGSDLKWDEDELHHAMEHHFSEWRDVPQWKLYLLIASHFKYYPERVVTGLMYDHQYRDPSDPHPRQGVAAFYTSMTSLWGDLTQGEFDRNYLRTCVHELGHALNLIHSFDKGRPESQSWMNYPWRYPYGYDLPPAWDGTRDFWKGFRFEFDAEELRHLRHHPLMEVIPGGVAFGSLGYDVTAPRAVSPQQQAAAPVALYVRTRPERSLFSFAEPVTVELKLQNQTREPMVVPDMLNPELGLLVVYIRDPKGQVREYRPLFRLCGEPRNAELPPGEKLFESVFLTYGVEGFYFQEPGEYQIWAVYGAGGMRLRSNVLRLRVAYPQGQDNEKTALWTFGRDQGHVLYMRGARHLGSGNDQLCEVTERFPTTHLARYIHLCFGTSQAREFKDVVTGQIRPPQIEEAVRHLEEASRFLRSTQQAALDNITYGRTIKLLADLYFGMEEFKEAKEALEKTVRYFTRMKVKPDVIAEFRDRARSIPV